MVYGCIGYENRVESYFRVGGIDTDARTNPANPSDIKLLTNVMICDCSSLFAQLR